jgi:ubiquitin fusion degradation protein 1
MVMAPGPNRVDANFGSKIILPVSALDKVSKLHVQWPLLMELINGEKEKHTHTGVLEFVAEEGRAYLPQWMMETLNVDVGDLIQVKTTSLELAKYVKLQPQSVNFLDISDPRAVLEKAFRNFATLTKGDVFNFEYNDEVFYIKVLDVKPETDKMGVSMIETDVSVDFAAPVGYVEPERQPKNSGNSTPRSGRGGLSSSGQTGGQLHTLGSMAKEIGYSAMISSASGASRTNFSGGGQRLTTKKSAKSSTPKPASPAPGAPSNTAADQPAQASIPPKPLRLPPNKLFLGYTITPFKSVEEKQEEAESSSKPRFAGQGQSLRSLGSKQSKAESSNSKDTK